MIKGISRRMVAVGLMAVLVMLETGLTVKAEPSVASQIREMTGARTKMAWIRGSNGIGHLFGPGMGAGDMTIWRIVVFDTDENGGQERYLTKDFGAYSHLQITPNGKRVLWTDGAVHGGSIWVSNWDGTNQHKLLDGPGLSVGVAEDANKIEWVYVMDESATGEIKPVYRYQIDDVSKKELVWNKTASNDKWEISRDGTWGASGFPWPQAGVAQLPNGEFRNMGAGCTPGSDGKHFFHMKAEGHPGIFIYDIDGSNKRYIDFASHAPGTDVIKGGQFWWCGFAKYDGRFFTFAGPNHSQAYTPGGGHVYFCRFNDKWDNFDKWIMVTQDPNTNTLPIAWIDPQKSPPAWAGLQIDSTLDSQMGASLMEPVVVTVKNNSDKDWKGRAQLTLEEGLKAEKPEGVEISVAKGATDSVTLNILKDPALNSGALRTLTADVSVLDAAGRVIDWSRKWFKVGCPVELAPLAPATFDEARQPVPVTVKNIAGAPVSGTISLELEGPAKLGPVEQDFGPIPSGEEATVNVMVPNMKIRGYDWQAAFTAKANGLETSLTVPLVVDRRWLMLGPFPNSVSNPWDQDYGIEKELTGGLDPAKTYKQTVAPTHDYNGWPDLKLAWDNYVKSDPTMKWTPSLPVRSIPGGPYAESVGYLNLFDYYLNTAKLPNQMAVTYCLAYVKSPNDRKVMMCTGQAGWMKVWINGQPVLTDKDQRAAIPGALKTEAELKAGWNEVVLKQGSQFFGYGFYFDFRTPDDKPMTDLYWTVDKGK